MARIVWLLVFLASLLPAAGARAQEDDDFDSIEEIIAKFEEVCYQCLVMDLDAANELCPVAQEVDLADACELKALQAYYDCYYSLLNCDASMVPDLRDCHEEMGEDVAECHGESSGDDDDDDGCGCQTGPDSPAALWVGLLMAVCALAWRRRSAKKVLR